MSIVVGNPTNRCPCCRLLMRRFLTSLPSRRESPWCRACWFRALIRYPNDRPDPAVPALVHQMRLMGRDPEQVRPVRVFALVVLEDRGEASDADLSLLRLLEAGASDDEIEATLAIAPPGPPAEQATGAHGAATEAPESPPPPPDGPVNREGRRRPPRKSTGEQADT